MTTTPHDKAIQAAANGIQWTQDCTFETIAENVVRDYLSSIGGVVCAREPVAWAHRLNLELDQFITEFTGEPEHPFGKPGEDYSPGYTVTSTPLHSPIEAGNGGDGWLPIETAPKDGTEIILYHPKGGVCAGFCPKEDWAWHVMDGCNTHVGRKSGVSIPTLTAYYDPPTHWRPLPSPPSTSDHEGEKQP